MIRLSWRAGCPSGIRLAGGVGGGLVQATGQQWCRHGWPGSRASVQGGTAQGTWPGRAARGRQGSIKGPGLVPPRGALCLGVAEGGRGCQGGGQGPTPGSALDRPVFWDPQFPHPHLVRLEPGCPSQPGLPSSTYILPPDRCLGWGGGGPRVCVSTASLIRQ